MIGNLDRYPMVTVVVPVYNVEKYLSRCIDSIVNQTYRNLEIILVDDGSPDKCPELCDEWAQKDSRIRVIHKKNQGLGMARNTGIENATGGYICFFDSDDWVDNDLIEKALYTAETENADLVCYGFYKNDSLGNVVSRQIPSASLVCFKDSDVQDVFLPDYIANRKHGTIKPIMSACACLIRKSRIDESHWRFISERKNISEDVYSILDLCKYVGVSCVMPEAFYHYCFNSDSLTHVYRKDRFEKILSFYEQCKLLCNKHGYNESVKESLKNPFLDYTCATMKQIVGASIAGAEKRTELSIICKNEILQTVISTVSPEFLNWKTRLLWQAVKLKQVWLVDLLVRMQVSRDDWCAPQKA